MDATPDYGLLPRGRTFAQSLPAFLVPYFAYAALASAPHRFLPMAAAEGLRFAVVLLLMLAFRRAYRFGPPLSARQAAAAAGMGLAGLAIWVLLYRSALALPVFRPALASAAATDPGPAYVVLRALNSVLLVPVFEELFCRAYAGEYLAGLRAKAGGLSARLFARMEEMPMPLSAPPTDRLAAGGSALIFMLGHGLAAWPAALGYFAVTTALYRRTRSFRACVLAHGLANLGVALLAHAGPGMRYLWY